jgi:acyl carrier protein
VDVIIDAEAKYNIDIDFDSSEKMITVGSCIDVIEEKANK